MRVTGCSEPIRFPDPFSTLKPTFIVAAICILLNVSRLFGDEAGMERAGEAYQAALWDVAAHAYRELLAENDLEPDLRTSIAIRLVECLIRDGRPAEALTWLDPDAAAAAHPAAMYWRGEALAGSGRFADAVDAFSAHLEVGDAPHRLEAALTSANLQISLGKASAAILTLGKFAETAEAGAAARANLQRTAILLDSGYPEDAGDFLPDVDDLPEKDRPFARYTHARLLLATGEVDDASERFAALLREPAGQSMLIHHGAALGLADTIAITTGTEAASRSLLGFLAEHPDSPWLDAAFRRLLAWLPESPTANDAILAKLAEWIPAPVAPATGIVTLADRASATWPSGTVLPEVTAFALFTRAVGMHRVGTPAAQHEAGVLMARLRVNFATHFLAHRSLLTEGRWHLETGRAAEALDLLSIAAESSRSGVIRGEALFLEAMALIQAGDLPAATVRFQEAAELLDDQAAEISRFNIAVAMLHAFPDEMPSMELGAGLRATLELERALAIEDPAKSLAALESFLRNHEAHPRSGEARLAAAERALRLETPDLSLALAQIESLGTFARIPDGATRASMVRLRIVEARKDPETATEIIEIARGILRDAPNTPAAIEASLALGRSLFDTGNFNEARIVFERLAIEQSSFEDSDPELIQAALLLAARAAALGATTQSREEALALFDRAVGVENASLGGIAALEKARLMIDLNRLDPAIESLKTMRETMAAENPLALPAGLLLGEAIYAKSSGNPAMLQEALAIYDELLDAASQDSGAIYNRLQYLRGITLEKLPRDDAPHLKRETEAIEAYYSVILRAGDGPPSEWEWFERCAFAALSLLEKAGRWQAAINLARRIASFNGPRAADAAERAAQLQLRHMIWED